jgi:hypothetical protein
MSSIFYYSFVERTQARQAVQFELEPSDKSHSRLALTQQLQTDLSAGSQDLTMAKATQNERIHNAVRDHQYKLKEVGDYLGLCYSTISVIAKRVDESNKSQESRRDPMPSAFASR